MTLNELREILELAWSKDTTYAEDSYDDHDCSWGQCIATAMVIQDYFGGSLRAGYAVRGNFRGRHYWNRLDGLNRKQIDVDLTWRQFPLGTRLIKEEPVSRFQLSKNEDIMKRYNRLAFKVKRLIELKPING